MQTPHPCAKIGFHASRLRYHIKSKRAKYCISPIVWGISPGFASTLMPSIIDQLSSQLKEKYHANYNKYFPN